MGDVGVAAVGATEVELTEIGGAGAGILGAGILGAAMGDAGGCSLGSGGPAMGAGVAGIWGAGEAGRGDSGASGASESSSNPDDLAGAGAGFSPDFAGESGGNAATGFSSENWKSGMNGSKKNCDQVCLFRAGFCGFIGCGFVQKYLASDGAVAAPGENTGRQMKASLKSCSGFCQCVIRRK